MKIRTLVRHVREGGKSVVRNGLMSFASISSIAISLFILGVFVVLMVNIGNITEDIEKKVEIRVFLDVSVGEEQIPEIQNELASIPEVSTIEFVSKEEGWLRLKESVDEEYQPLIEGYEGDENPLPDSFTVKVDEPQNVGQVAEQILALDNGREAPRFIEVDYGSGTVERLFRVVNAIRYVMLVLVLGLAFTAMFLISNTIKLTIAARSREIAIMKLVGATNSFIRWPFFVEGALLGLIGAAIPIVAIVFGYRELFAQARREFVLYNVGLVPADDLNAMIIPLLLGIGIVIGIWGSVISVRKYLRV